MKVVLQLKHSRLLESDYEILNHDDAWFTDSLIAVWFEFLETYAFNRQYKGEFIPKLIVENSLHMQQKNNDHIKKEIHSCTNKQENPIEVIFLDPSTASWILHESDLTDLSTGLLPLNLKAKDVICIPVNNSTSTSEPCSGTHWSLLVYSKQKLHIKGLSLNNSNSIPQFFSFNSMSHLYDRNEQNAQLIALKLGPFLEIPPSLFKLPQTQSSVGVGHIEANVIEIACGPQQDESSCGVWIALIAEEVVCSILMSSVADLSFNDSVVRKKRLMMKQTLDILKLRIANQASA